jgi:hypothetical protein
LAALIDTILNGPTRNVVPITPVANTQNRGTTGAFQLEGSAYCLRDFFMSAVKAKSKPRGIS